MKKYIGLLSFCILVSCSAKKAVIAETVANDKLTADKIIDNHYKNKLNFNTLYIKSNVSYRDPSQTQNVTAEIKIKKNEIEYEWREISELHNHNISYENFRWHPKFDIDACDEIMDHIDKPKGLIRYASENNIAQKQKTTYFCIIAEDFRTKVFARLAR